MIFLTTGSELPFNRLTRAVDEWCQTRSRSDVFGQLGDLGESDYHPTNFRWKPFLEPSKYSVQFEEASLIVAHAGMGSIISALTLGKSIVIMPRLVKFHETRNDHQVATLERFVERENVFAARDEGDVAGVLDQVLSSRNSTGGGKASPYAEKGMTDSLRALILNNSQCA